MQLTHSEVVKAKAELRRHVWIRKLLARQRDVESDRRRADLLRAAIGRLHDARPAARHQKQAAIDIVAAALADEPAELARDVVVTALRVQTLGDREQPLELGVGRRSAQ